MGNYLNSAKNGTMTGIKFIQDKFFSNIFNQKPFKVLMFGLDSGGKTTILYRLKLGETVTTIPTVGFNVEDIYIKRVKLVVWDLGLRDKGCYERISYILINFLIIYFSKSPCTTLFTGHGCTTNGSR